MTLVITLVQYFYNSDRPAKWQCFRGMAGREPWALQVCFDMKNGNSMLIGYSIPTETLSTTSEALANSTVSHGTDILLDITKTMKAIAVESYGGVEELQARMMEFPGKPKGRELLVQVKVTSVNPIDIKVRKRVYDDAPDYCQKVAGLKPIHCIGFDGAGVVVEVGPDVKNFQPVDEVFDVSNPTLQGTNKEYQIVIELTVGHKPKTLDFVESTALPLTYGTAYETLVERMGIKKGENVGLLIINGAGGVGLVASQITRSVLELLVVITTASRPETIAFTKRTAATRVINHGEDLRPQIKNLNLDVPIM